MPKSQFIDPQEMLKPGKIQFKDIPVNQYNKTIEEEVKIYGKEALMRIYRDMVAIREFETMLNLIKTQNAYNGVEYSYPGPAHLSYGQEASVVGMAYHLDINDFTFGTHRSHGEIIAKGLSAIEKLDDKDTYEIMKNFLGGKTLAAVEGKEEDRGCIKDLAFDFLLYGALAEIFGRETGFSKGLGGSMHAFFLPFGIYPNNAIVGGGVPAATGAALYKRVNRKPGIIVANFGDGATGRGPVLESFNFSAMDQIKKLWHTTEKDGYNAGLPILFNVYNNFYAMGGQTYGETMAWDMLARIGAGVNPEQMHAERVNGFNPLALIDAFERKKKILLEGNGPVLLDTITYRYTGHSPSDSSTYRTEEEIEAWKKFDSIESYKDRLISGGVAEQSEFDAIQESISKRMTKICRLATDDAVSPRIDLDRNPDTIASIMFSNEHREVMEEGREPDVLMPMEENPRVKKISELNRFAYDEKGAKYPALKTYNVRDGLFEAIIDKFYKDPTLIAYGEDNRDWGGAYAVYRGLTECLPYHRFFNSPISESAIVGTAVGYAMCGGRAIVEIMYADFLACCGDELFNQLAKWQSMSAGLLKMPVIVRVSVGSKYGAQHSQDWTALCAHIPGLKVVFPSTPYDCKGLMTAALNGTDPVIFFESQRVYGNGEQFHKEGVPKESYEITIGDPDVKLEGKDVTILTIGAVLYRAIEAAKTLKEKYGIEAEVIDSRSIVPFNYEKVIESVKKTGKIVVVGDACERNSVMKDMAANINELAFDYLDAPAVALGSRNWITPAYELEKYFFPQATTIIDAIHEKLMPIPGYTPTYNLTDLEKADRSKKGV